MSRLIRAKNLPQLQNAILYVTPAEKAAIIGLLALVSVALTIWAARRRGSTGGSDSIKLQAILKLH